MSRLDSAVLVTALLLCTPPSLHAATGQNPPAPAPVPPSQTPPAGQPAPRPPVHRPSTAAANRTTTATVTVTDSTGQPLPGTAVTMTGPVERTGRTAANGSVHFAGLRAGVYRVRFEHEGFIAFEREVNVPGTQAEEIGATLTAAPPPPAPEPAPPAPVSSTTAPAGEPRALVLVDFIEKNLVSGKDPKREDQLGCTASARTMLVQLRDNSPEQATNDADEVLYVIAGEGTLRLGNRDVPVQSSSVAVVPRGTARGLMRKGRNPLIVLSVISGPPCTK
jgi:mannose-6-phosphate isomerase-like protein (cupin superfamily)